MSNKITGKDFAKLISEAMGLKVEAERRKKKNEQPKSNEQLPSVEATEEPPVDLGHFTDEIPPSRGALGDLQMQDYGKEGRKIPTYYRDVFENSGILKDNTLRGRIQALENYAKFLTSQNDQVGLEDANNNTFSVEQEVGNVFVLDAFTDILSQSSGRDASGLQDLGFLTEGFVALLFSGAKIGSDSGWTDVITNVEAEGNFSVKFMSKKSTNYQALSTVYNHFQSTDEPMRFLNIVKSSITKDYNEIKFFMTRYTKEDFEEATTGMELSYGQNKKGQPDVTKIQGAENLQSTKALITKDGIKYYFENPIAFASNKELGLTNLQAGTTNLSAKAKIGDQLNAIEVSGNLEEPKVTPEETLKKEKAKNKKIITSYEKFIKELEELDANESPDDKQKKRIEKIKSTLLQSKQSYVKAKTDLIKIEADLKQWYAYKAQKSQQKKGDELIKDLRGSYSVDPGKQPRITFTEFGDLVGTLTMPSLKDFNEAKRNRLTSLNTKIVQITDSLKELQAAAVLFSSTSEDGDKKEEAAEKVNAKFKESKELLAGELGKRSQIQESKKITADFLKKLISESFKK